MPMLFAVLTAHLALLGVIVGAGRHRSLEPMAPAQQRTTLRLLGMAVPPLPSDRFERPASNTALRPAERLPARATPPASPAPVTAGDAAMTSLPITPPAPPASAPVPLESIWLPLLETEASKRAIRESALAPREVQADPRVTLGQKVNDVVGGDGRLVEEDLGNDRRRFRQNGDCTETTATRASQLFPENTLPKPKLTGACP